MELKAQTCSEKGFHGEKVMIGSTITTIKSQTGCRISSQRHDCIQIVTFISGRTVSTGTSDMLYYYLYLTLTQIIQIEYKNDCWQ